MKKIFFLFFALTLALSAFAQDKKVRNIGRETKVTVDINTDIPVIVDSSGKKVGRLMTANEMKRYATTDVDSAKANIRSEMSNNINYVEQKKWDKSGNVGTSWQTNFLGTIDNVSLRFRTNNSLRMIIDSIGRVGIGTENIADALTINGNIRLIQGAANGNHPSINITRLDGSNYNLMHLSPTGSLRFMSPSGFDNYANGISANNIGIGGSRLRAAYFGYGHSIPDSRFTIFMQGGNSADTSAFTVGELNSRKFRIQENGNVGIMTTNEIPNSTLHLNGSISTPITGEIQSDYTLTDTDHFVLVYAGAQSYNVNLPSAVGRKGRQYVIKKTDLTSNTVNFLTINNEKINKVANYQLTLSDTTVFVVSDGANWWTF